jgi:hypothetical protein
LNEHRSPIVWVVEQGAFDYSPARVFGQEIRVLSADKLAPNADTQWHAKTIQQVRKALMDYIPGVDFVIPTGRPVRMMLVAMVMMERGSHHKLLGWDDKTQRYFLYDLNLRQPYMKRDINEQPQH